MCQPKARLSALVPMLNEELNIAACLRSLQFCDEIWVVDSHSRDQSPKIAETLGANVIQFDYLPGGPKKKNWALANIPFKHSWVLIIDADERVPPELAAEIRAAVDSPGPCVGYYLNRRVFFSGRWLRHCWYPSWNLRLFQHRLGRYEQLESGRLETGDNEVHEHVILDGRTRYFRHDLLHHDYRSLHQFIERHNRYSTWEAEHRLRELSGRTNGLTPSLFRGPVERRRWWKCLFLRMPGKPVWRFLYTYLWRRGFLDGYPGFVISIFMAIYEFQISMKIQELKRLGWMDDLEATAESQPLATQPEG